MLQVVDLQVEYKTNPIGMDEYVPRFYYTLEGDSLCQSARQIVVTCECGKVVWDSGWVEDDVTFQIEYAGEFLKPFTRYYWKVRVQDEAGAESDWTDGTAFFETGFLGGAWEGKWISFAQTDCYLQEVGRLRGDFTVNSKKKVAKARLYVTALGLYHAYVNGTNVTEDLFTPGWTQYDKRVQYQAYDVTDMLAKGKNALCFELAEGWYGGLLPRHWLSGGKKTYDYPKLLAELHITYADGTKEKVLTGNDFKRIYITGDNSGMSRIKMSDIYMGETYWSMEQGNVWLEKDWSMGPGPKFGSPGGVGLCVHDTLKDAPEIVWQSGAPVRHIMDVKPVSITKRKNGNWIVDFGQNLTGRERIHLKDIEAGTMIVIRHGEMLTADGCLYTENLRDAAATTTYICHCNKAEEVYEPSFTFYGFRYVEITGWPGKLTANQIEARVIHSDLKRTGTFTCSEPLINQLYSNVIWGQRSNFLDVPTDCPQRDERLGWTGDTQVFANVASFNMYSPEFYTKWLADLNACRTPDGAYTHFAPFPYGNPWGGVTGWSDAGVICPWVMFRKFGDTRLMRKYYDNMCQWLDWQINKANGSLIVKNAHYGDWLNMDAPTDERLLSTAYMGGMNKLVADMAALLGQYDDYEYRMHRYEQVKEAYVKEFFTTKGELKVKTQTAALLSLAFGLVPEKWIAKTVAFLVKDIRVTHDLHLSTGFLGTPLLLKVLTEYGEVDLAYDLLMQTTYPGWLYPVTQGATTMWERWNTWTKDDGFGDVGMNSFNHYAYGAVAEWFYETICGIQDMTDCVCCGGFHRFRLAPQFGKKLSHAAATFQSMSGEITSSWKRTGKKVVWSFTVPCNTMAEIVLPDGVKLPKAKGITVEDGLAVALPGEYKLTLTVG